MDNCDLRTGTLTLVMILVSLSGCGTSSSGDWTWVGGSNTVNQTAVYGVEGTPAASSTPGGRQFAVGWSDRSENFWFFGGLSAQNDGSFIYFNDLWKYSAGEWTWMSGSNLYDQLGSYGTMGVAAPGNVPGARIEANGWTDPAGNLWLFGGFGFDSTGPNRFLNDLWKYSAGEWTWMSGSNVGNQSGIYGTLGTAAPGNIPGARSLCVTWTDSSGDLWLFGGDGYDSVGNDEYLNDLWKYSGGQWTWVSGSNLVDQPGSYGTLGVPAPGNAPGARLEASGWTDSSGNLWLFGGSPGPKGQANFLNDLWKFSSGEWTWMGGSDSIDQSGSYGTKGIPDSANIPGARLSAATWIDSSGDVYLFGGNGYDSTGNWDLLNDLWKYSGGKWTWVSGSKFIDQFGSYGAQGVAASSNIPGARYSDLGWIDSSGNFCLFGGAGLNASQGGWLDDLWCYRP